jgi:hypothetical protein
LVGRAFYAPRCRFPTVAVAKPDRTGKIPHIASAGALAVRRPVAHCPVISRSDSRPVRPKRITAPLSAAGPIVGYSDAQCVYDKGVADQLMSVATELDLSPIAAFLLR